MAALSACAQGKPPVGINDPHEENNRQTHAFNKALDRTFVDPLSDGYGSIIPDEMRLLVSNFSQNLGEPGNSYNFVLQGKFKAAGTSLLRFAVNSTAGIFGIVDVVEEFGTAGTETDFGETLHVWGVAEGTYEELPFFGPSTTRDTVGFAVDIFVNPLTFLNFEGLRQIGIASYLVARLDDRYNYSSTVDSVLYDSSDSYAQSRILYLQNRRYRLGIDAAEFGSDADPYADPYLDPYEDPYAN